MGEIKPPWRPKDGPGPRGVPDCYYTSRVLNSTHRYTAFVNRMRKEEAAASKGAEQALIALRDKQLSDFSVRTDRKNCIKSVARKVELCMESYEEDVQDKRARLRSLLSAEEESDTRALVVQAQSGLELIARDKENRLLELREKRRQENLEKYKSTPLSKCAHITELLFSKRKHEDKDCQLYQMKEKQSLKLQQAEFDKMWYEVTLRQDEALAARAEYDAIERYRRDIECKEYSDHQIADKKIREEIEKQRLKEETIRMREQCEALDRKAEAEEKALEAKRYANGLDRAASNRETEAEVIRQKEAAKLIQDTFDSLKDESNDEIRRNLELRNRKARENMDCNRQLIELKKGMQKYIEQTDELTNKEALKQQAVLDERRCVFERKRIAMNKEAQAGVTKQIEDHKRVGKAAQEAKLDERNYIAMTHGHLQRLDDLYVETLAEKKKKHQQHLRDQIAFQRKLREEAEREEMAVLEKYKTAEKEYKEEVAEMLRRPFFSDHVHGFTRQIAKGMTLPRECPCGDHSKDYCAKS